MAEQVVTQFVLDLSQYDAQIASATDSMAEYDAEATEAAKANKDLSGSVGSASTKVTQLATASKAAGKGIKDVGTATKDASKNAGGFKAAFGAAKDELNSAFPVFGKIATAAKALGRAFTVALGPVGIVIAAVVAGIGLLLKAFAGTQEGADKLAKVTAVLGAVFDRLLGVAQVLGKAIFDTFSDPQQAVSDLWEAIKTNLSNRLDGFIEQWKALGDVIAGVFTLDSDRISEGVDNFGEATTRVLTGVVDLTDKASKAFSDFGDEIEKAAETGARIAEIDRNLRALALNRAEQEGRITRELEEQRAIVSDVTKSSAQRTAAAQKFNALQKQLTDFETRRLDLEIERGNLAASTSDTLDEEKIRIAELVSAKEEALARELAANREINNQINGLNKAAADKAIAEAQRATAERIKAQEEELAATIERVKAQDALDLDLNNRKAALLKQELEFIKKAQEDELLLRVAGGEDQIDVLAEQAQQRQNILAQIQEAEVVALLAKFDAEYEAAVQSGVDLAALSAQQEAELAAFKTEQRNKDLESIAAYYEQAEQLAVQAKDAEVELQLVKLDAFQQGADILGKLAGENKAAAAVALAAQKAAAVAQVIIATQSAIAAASAAAASIPAVIPPGIPNPAFAIAQALAAAQIAKVVSLEKAALAPSSVQAAMDTCSGSTKARKSSQRTRARSTLLTSK